MDPIFSGGISNNDKLLALCSLNIPLTYPQKPWFENIENLQPLITSILLYSKMFFFPNNRKWNMENRSENKWKKKSKSRVQNEQEKVDLDLASSWAYECTQPDIP